MPQKKKIEKKDIMMELMTLGAVLVGTFPEGAKIVARAMEEIEQLYAQVSARRKPSVKKKTTKAKKLTRR